MLYSIAGYFPSFVTFRVLTSTLSVISLLCLLMVAPAQAGQPKESATAKDVEKWIDQSKGPMYTPFVESYLLQETKDLRREMMSTKAELIEKVVEKEVTKKDKAVVLCKQLPRLAVELR